VVQQVVEDYETNYKSEVKARKKAEKYNIKLEERFKQLV
jgi:hypothetical protein